jgi:hypothetical protein
MVRGLDRGNGWSVLSSWNRGPLVGWPELGPTTHLFILSLYINVDNLTVGEESKKGDVSLRELPGGTCLSARHSLRRLSQLHLLPAFRS